MTIKDLKLNAYGNVDGIPKGFVSTSLTVSQLKKLNIQTAKACTGFNQSGRYCNPIIVNIITKRSEKKANKYLEEIAEKKKSKPQPFFQPKRKIQRYAEYMTDDIEVQERIIEAYDNNKSTKGNAWRLFSQAYCHGEKRDMWDIFRIMETAYKRHAETDYDLIDKRGMSETQIENLRSTFNRIVNS